MNPRLSNKIMRPDFQGEFTASILAAAASPDLNSFAGGLPNPVSFPVEAMDKATHKVLEKNGVMALQYSGTQGYLPLREGVAKRYETMGVYGVTADDKAKQYWAFYVDGKYAEKGVDATEIVAGAPYALKLESYS